MSELRENEQQKISKFIELSLSLILKGFDEMEMQKRLELVKLFGFVINLGVEQYYGRLLELERRLQQVEEKSKKKY
jgi:hypothetical protein